MNMNKIASVATLPRNDERKAAHRNDEQKKLNWQDNLPVQKLLDVIASVLAEEYIQVAKQNSGVFSNDGGKK